MSKQFKVVTFRFKLVQEFHSDLSAQEIKVRVVANRKKTKTKKQVEVYQSDSSLVNTLGFFYKNKLIRISRLKLAKS